MSNAQPTPEQSTALEFNHYAVIDRHGVCIRMDDLKDAKTCKRNWDKGYQQSGPHRIVEVLWREVKP